jgi:hypothetical protein
MAININNLSVFYIKDTGPQTGTLSPDADESITQITYQRPSNEDTFRPNSIGFRLHSTIPQPPLAGIDSTKPLCVVNRKGANGGGALDLFVVTTGGRIAWISTTTGGNSWGSWDESTLMPPSGASIDSGPAVSAFATDRMVLIIRGDNNQLYRRFFDGTNWGGWITTPALGTPPNSTIVGEPAVIGFPTNDYRVYVRTSTNQLWYLNFDGANFGTWQQLPNVITTSSPEGVDVAFTESGATQVADQLEGMNIFYRGNNNEMRLVRTSPNGVNSSPDDLGGGLTSASGSVYFRDEITPPSSLAGNVYRELHTFVRGNDGLLYGKYGELDIVLQDVHNFSNWYSFGFAPGGFGRIFNKPDAVTWWGTPIFP